MDYLPVFMDVKKRFCLVAGGGEVAFRKATLLQRCGARLLVVAPDIRDDLRALVEQSDGEIRQREFQDSDLDDAMLVIAATSDEAVNQRISHLASARKMPVNVVDQPELCTFIVPAIVDRSPVVLAISTGGSSPVLTRQLKEKLEISIPAAYGRLAAMLGRFRAKVKEQISDFEHRTRFWENLLQGPLSEMVFAGKDQEAEAYIEHQIGQADELSVQGEVYLVGAGPGDPDLLTLKALRLMYAADVVLYDRLVSPEILARVRPDAEKIHVGKEPKSHPVPQEEINALLVRLAGEGKKVLRLKGGDPFIFGRGGEEIDSLAEKHIPFQVVPGITAASGCACYAGIPLTHRDYSQSVRFVTGHLKNDQVDLDWPALVHGDQTLVIYMGLIGLPNICKQLIAHGMSAEMPIAVVQQGTTNRHFVLTGTLESMPGLLEKTPLQAPTLIIIGQVVKLHRELAWFMPGESLNG